MVGMTYHGDNVCGRNIRTQVGRWVPVPLPAKPITDRSVLNPDSLDSADPNQERQKLLIYTCTCTKEMKKLLQFEEFLSSKLGSSSGYGLSNNTEPDSLAPNP
jgi:hypothetical protein